ncbi:MAG: putative lipid II flippase FtsW [Spirochaetales bacterium]|nr:putative lipid II flippase FtsW [Spirochaetales bacterium]
MGQRFILEPLEKDARDKEYFGLVLSTLLLVGLGLSVLLSSSFYRGAVAFRDPYYFFRNQLVFVGLGSGVALFLSFYPGERIQRWVPWMFLSGLLLMGLVFVPQIGLTLLGGRRWIQIGSFTFQPSEFMKVGMVLHLAHLLSRRQDRLGNFTDTLFPTVLIVVVLFFLVLGQNDFSSAVLFLGLGFLMIFVAGVSFTYIFALIFTGSALATIFLLSKETRVNRLLAFLDPEQDPIGKGFQVLSSKTALMNGGLTGLGIGQGVRKLGGLPEANSDYIFAVLGEEMGFLGVVGVMGLFGIFAWFGYRTAFRHGRTFIGLSAFGLTSGVLLQALLNMAVVSGVLPPTGITLPFFSSGGSSMVMTLITVGLLLSFSRVPNSEEREEHFG